MLPTTTPLHDYSCRVIFNRTCGHGLKILRLQVMPVSGQPVEFQCSPGQFVMLDLPVSRFHFRRPFSVLATHADGSFDLYYKIVGEGTRMMADFEPGLEVKCLGPLGIGFSAPGAPDTALYVGGGIGIAPLAFLGRVLTAGGHCFYGVRSQAEIGLESELRDSFGDNLHIATDDGSFGTAGNVCDLLKQHPEKIKNAQEAYICGPTRMMEASVKLLYSVNPNLRIQVSLEEHMPCGTGACTGCVVERADQTLPSKVCVEGPVFEAQSIRWQSDVLLNNSSCEEPSCPL